MIHQITSALYAALLMEALFVVPCAGHALYQMFFKNGKRYEGAKIIPTGILLVWISTGLLALYKVVLESEALGYFEPMLLVIAIAGGLCLIHGLGWFIAKKHTSAVAFFAIVIAFVWRLVF